jgi:hypothetical protein
MATGIFTPVEGSTKKHTFDMIRGTFAADQKFDYAPVAGDHVMIQVHGKQPVFYSVAEPATPEEGFLGTPVFPHSCFVIPRAATCWIFCPYQAQEVFVTVGTLT